MSGFDKSASCRKLGVLSHIRAEGWLVRFYETCSAPHEMQRDEMSALWRELSQRVLNTLAWKASNPKPNVQMNALDHWADCSVTTVWHVAILAWHGQHCTA